MKKFILFLSAVLILSLTSCATRVVTRPTAKVTVIKTPPKHYKIVRIKGKRYYYWNGRHHKKTRKGYVVVRV